MQRLVLNVDSVTINQSKDCPDVIMMKGKKGQGIMKQDFVFTMTAPRSTGPSVVEKLGLKADSVQDSY
jgi:hypothetical protein